MSAVIFSAISILRRTCVRFDGFQLFLGSKAQRNFIGFSSHSHATKTIFAFHLFACESRHGVTAESNLLISTSNSFSLY